jgi:flavin-binding protein dodecin
MSVARVTEISVTSPTSFDDAVREGIARASQTLRGVSGAWIKDQRVLVENGKITGYRVLLKVSFVLD